MTTRQETLKVDPAPAAMPGPGTRRGRPRWAPRPRRADPLAALGALAWLVVVGLPLYYLVTVSLRTRADYLTAGPLTPPTSPTLDNYRLVLTGEFGRYFLNTAVVTAVSIAGVLALALPAAYAVVRGRHPLLRAGFSMLLLGLAIPSQAVIVPVYLIITRLHLYDSLTAIILPTVAFSLPVAMVVLTSHLRDIPKELYESMIMDGGTPASIFFQLVVPSSRPALVSVGIYSGLNAWNGFIFPLVLTQSRERQVIPLGLWNFQSQFGTDVPGLFAAVLISALPVLALYLFGRRHLLRGLSAGYGK